MKIAHLSAAAAAVVLLLAACATPPPKSEPAAPPSGEADQCGQGKLDAYLGKPADEPTLAAVRAAAGHDRIRVIRPGTAVTMDYRADRLNVDIGEDGRIRRFYCS